MIIVACDGCRRQSPDEGGLNVARVEGWITCTFQREDQREREKGYRQKLILCGECLPKLNTPELEIRA